MEGVGGNSDSHNNSVDEKWVLYIVVCGVMFVSVMYCGVVCVLLRVFCDVCCKCFVLRCCVSVLCYAVMCMCFNCGCVRACMCVLIACCACVRVNSILWQISCV